MTPTKLTPRTDRLLALILLEVSGRPSQRNSVRLLSLAGFSVVEMADLLETTAKGIQGTLRRL